MHLIEVYQGLSRRAKEKRVCWACEEISQLVPKQAWKEVDRGPMLFWSALGQEKLAEAGLRVGAKRKAVGPRWLACWVGSCLKTGLTGLRPKRKIIK